MREEQITEIIESVSFADDFTPEVQSEIESLIKEQYQQASEQGRYYREGLNSSGSVLLDLKAQSIAEAIEELNTPEFDRVGSWLDLLTGDRFPLCDYPGWRFLTYRDELDEKLTGIIWREVYGQLPEDAIDEVIEYDNAHAGILSELVDECVETILNDVVDGMEASHG